jgi:hypothetical protein
MTRRSEHVATLLITGAQAMNKVAKSRWTPEARLPNHELDNTGAEALYLLSRDFVKQVGKDGALKVADCHMGYADFAKHETTKVAHLQVASALYEAIDIVFRPQPEGDAAAAPDLLSVLREIRQRIQLNIDEGETEWTIYTPMIDAAIAKAEGT